MFSHNIVRFIGIASRINDIAKQLRVGYVIG